MSVFTVVGLVGVYRVLQGIDKEFSLKARAERCPKCKGALHGGSYKRKPRGGPSGLPDDLSIRFSLCCEKEGCRGRVLPRSVMFDGRKVYWRMVILVVIALRAQRGCGFTMEKLKAELGVDGKTVRRWQKLFLEERFTAGGSLRGLSGYVPGGLPMGGEIATLVSFFISEDDLENGMVRLLRFIAEHEHLMPGKMKLPQKTGSSQRGKRDV